MYCVYLKTNGAELPELGEDESRYVVAENGTFLERRTSMYTACTRVDRYDLDLCYQEPYCVLHCGRLSRAMHRAMLAFFLHAHRLHDGEAALVLLYHPERRQFRWHCPTQTVEMRQSANRWVTLDTIEFDNPLELPAGFLHFGDAHLHPGPPNPSLLDMQDDQDGLHIIVGNIDRPRPQYNVDFVMDGARFRVRPETIFEDPDCTAFERAPFKWMQKIQIRKVFPRSLWSDDYRKNDPRDSRSV
jgi:hypothetical protein